MKTGQKSIFYSHEAIFFFGLDITMTEPPLKSGVHRLKINQGILNEAKMHKHTYKAYKIMIKIEIKLLQLCLDITR
jgi:hypothetical protein